MVDTPTEYAGLRRQGKGENLNTWGDPNLNINFELTGHGLEGVKTIALTGSRDLTSTDYVENEVRYAVLRFQGGTLVSSPTVKPPAKGNKWVVYNNEAFPIVFQVQGSAGTTFSVPAGRAAEVATDGVDMFGLAYASPADAAQAAASAISAASSAGTATTQKNLAVDNKNYSAEWANKAEDSPVSVAAGGDGATTFSAKHWALKALAAALQFINLSLPITLFSGVARTLRSKLEENVSVLDFGAGPDKNATVNTASIQAAIDYVYSRGGGNVRIPFIGTGIYNVEQSTATDQIENISSGNIVTYSSLGASCSLAVRAGVYLLIESGVTINNQVPNRTIIMLYNVTDKGAGVIGVGGFAHLTSNWDVNNPVGAGHGITNADSGQANTTIACGMVLENLHIYKVASYGIGIQYASPTNCRYSNLWIADTGADGIDHKARPLLPSRQPPKGISMRDILIERHGRRAGITGSAGIDVRGIVQLSNIHVRDFAYETKGNVGVRFSSGVYSVGGVDVREPSAGSSLTNFFIDSGDPTAINTSGVVLLSSPRTTISNGTIKNCRLSGVNCGSASSSGYGFCEDAKVINVSIEGSYESGVDAASRGVRFIGISVRGLTDGFFANAGNLIAGQTVFITPRKHLTASVRIYKNDVLLALGADYSITSETEFVLTSGVLVTDRISVVTPTAIAYNMRAELNALVDSVSTDSLTPLAIDAVAGSTLTLSGNYLDGQGQLRTVGGAVPYLEAYGPLADYEADIRAKANAGVTLRSNGARALRAVNPASAVNWAQAQGSATGQPIQFTVAGSDANIDVQITPKGTSGRVRLGAHTANADAAITGYIEIKDAGGTTRKLAVIS